MNDPHKRRTPQNTRGANDLITKREAYHGTKRMIDGALVTAGKDAYRIAEVQMLEHIEQYHTPAWRKLWRRIREKNDD